MRLLIRLAVTAVLFAGLALSAQESSSARALFQRGLMLERAEGNVTQAIVLFERVVAEYPGDRAVVPQALYHLARLYEPTDTERASRMWSRIASEFSQTEYAEEARLKTAALQAQAAGPFSMRSLDAVMNGRGLDYYNCSDCEVSPDGRRVVWIAQGADTDALLVRDLETGREQTILSERRRVQDVDWSWDGTRISVRIAPRQADGQAREMRVMEPNGTLVRSFTIPDPMGPIRAYWWTGDSRRIVTFLAPIEQSQSGLQILDVSTGNMRFLAGANSWTWSPDGSRIFYMVPGPPTGDKFFTADLATGQTREVPVQLNVTRAADRLNIATGVTRNRPWTTTDEVLVRQAMPDGGTFYLVTLSTGAVRKTCINVLTSLRRCGQLTPDGRQQLVEDGLNRRIMVIDVATGAERRLTNGFGDEESASLSPDGRVVTFLSNPDGKWGMYVVPLDRAPVANPIRMATFDEYPGDGIWPESWAPDGRLVSSVAFADENIYRINMDRDGRPARPAGRLTQDLLISYSPVVSPDSGRIAYLYRSGLKQGIALMSADGAGERPVIQQPQIPPHLEWFSADELLFNPASASNVTGMLSALNVNTGTIRQIGDLPGGFNWQYVPSRGEVVYIDGAVDAPFRTFHARSLKDGADREIVRVDRLLPYRFTFRVSPDGRQIAYGRWTGEGNAQRAEMHLVSMDGGGDRILTTSGRTNWAPSGFPYAWSPDGRFLLYDAAPGVLTVLDVQAGTTWPIAEATDGESHAWSGAQWAPDGSYIVLSRSGWRAEYKAFQGLTYEAVTRLMAAATGPAAERR